MCGVADAFGTINKSRHMNELLFHKKNVHCLIFSSCTHRIRWFLNNCMLWFKCLLDELFSVSNMELTTRTKCSIFSIVFSLMSGSS